MLGLSSRVMATQPASAFGWFQPSPIPDVATAQTIRFMCGCIDGSAKSSDVQAIARDAAARFGDLGAFDVGAGAVLTGQRTDADLARATYWYVRYNVRRLHHGEFKSLVAAFPEKKQLIVSPDVLFLSYPQGDCSAFTMGVCALLKCLGIGYELVAVAADARDPSIYTHVYPRAVLSDGTKLALDAHAGDYPGWEIPPEDTFRKQAYDASGTPVFESPRFQGLHQYQWRGLGDDDLSDIDEITYNLATGATPLDPVYANYADGATNSSLPLSTVAASTTGTSPSSGFNWSSEIANLANAWTKIGGQVVAPQVTETSGNTSISGPASALTSLTSGISSMSGSSLMELLLIGGAFFLAVKLMGAK